VVSNRLLRDAALAEEEEGSPVKRRILWTLKYVTGRQRDSK